MSTIPRQSTQQTSKSYTPYTGPIPPPDFLRDLDSVVPGQAAKILKLAEDQSRHRIKLELQRMELEKTIVLSGIRRSWGGLIAGFVIAIATICAGAWVAIASSPSAGATIATATVVALASVFVIGTKSQQHAQQTKAKSKDETV